MPALSIAVDVCGGDDLDQIAIGIGMWSSSKTLILKVESAVEGVYALSNGLAQAFVSAGDTQKVVRAATRLGRIKIQPPGSGRPRRIKPSIALELPTQMDGKHFVLCDAGGSVEVDEYDLVTFAHAGATYFQELEFNPYQKKVRVGILAIGEGNDKLRPIELQCLELLREVQSFESMGGVEPLQIISGEVDVVICSGRDGNLALKGVEAGAVMEHSIMRQEFNRGVGSRVAGIWVKLIGTRAFTRVRSRLDESRYAGGILFGFEDQHAAIFICHGRSKAKDIYAALERAHSLGDQTGRMQATFKQKLIMYHPDWFPPTKGVA